MYYGAMQRNPVFSRSAFPMRLWSSSSISLLPLLSCRLTTWHLGLPVTTPVSSDLAVGKLRRVAECHAACASFFLAKERGITCDLEREVNVTHYSNSNLEMAVVSAPP
jgi:hypothetical protein